MAVLPLAVASPRSRLKPSPHMTATVDDLLQPLSARSVIASALLGTHPPQLRGRLLVAFAQEFGIGAGTARVALSRMVDRGELTNDNGLYSLAGALAARQRRQDLGRESAAPRTWDGTWEQVVVVEAGRAANDRVRLRAAFHAARMGEVKEGVWMRPNNLDRDLADVVPGELVGHVMWFRVEPVDPAAASALAVELFDLAGWSRAAQRLHLAMQQNPKGMIEQFRVAAAALQHLTRDPLLPSQLYPDSWPGDSLRGAYRTYEAELQTELRAFFAAA